MHCFTIKMVIKLESGNLTFRYCSMIVYFSLFHFSIKCSSTRFLLRWNTNPWELRDYCCPLHKWSGHSSKRICSCFGTTWWKWSANESRLWRCEISILAIKWNFYFKWDFAFHRMAMVSRTTVLMPCKIFQLLRQLFMKTMRPRPARKQMTLHWFVWNIQLRTPSLYDQFVCQLPKVCEIKTMTDGRWM